MYTMISVNVVDIVGTLYSIENKDLYICIYLIYYFNQQVLFSLFFSCFFLGFDTAMLLLLLLLLLLTTTIGSFLFLFFSFSFVSVLKRYMYTRYGCTVLHVPYLTYLLVRAIRSIDRSNST